MALRVQTKSLLISGTATENISWCMMNKRCQKLHFRKEKHRECTHILMPHIKYHNQFTFGNGYYCSVGKSASQNDGATCSIRGGCYKASESVNSRYL
ncbi:uncharacterized protein LOC131034316 isoform X2 [Cryptomeria japonica]|uniref:uncharacterized protein LOC131034316 isoform X2 n=1 Tax=Cryptomeria japonica TaxID=3369 RepID=UPI0027DA66A7|nr:uncharacterized protein LOC131034316 isoform X2 [Cryptomeria japonica]